jgi:hypothetical protein
MKITEIVQTVRLSEDYNSAEATVKAELSELDNVEECFKRIDSLAYLQAEAVLQRRLNRIAEKKTQREEDKQKKADKFLEDTKFGKVGA